MSGAILYPRTDGGYYRKYLLIEGILYLRMAGKQNKGKLIGYSGWKLDNFEYMKRDRNEYDNLRKNFNSTIRKSFLKNLATEYKNELLKAGFTELEIIMMEKDGKCPDGYQVHHLIPLDDTGENSFENLVLIRNVSEHTSITKLHQAYTKNMKVGDSKQIKLPVPNSTFLFYPKTKEQEPLIINEIDPRF